MRRLIDRRTFLQSTGLAALTSFWPDGLSFAAPAPLAAARNTSSIALPFAMSKFNGGRSQVGVNALQWGGAYPFLNLLKTAQLWSLNDGSGPPAPDTLDSDGYPLKITNGGVYTIFYAPDRNSRPGNYVVTWTGNGTLSLGMNNTKVSGSLTSTSGSGRYVFSTTDTRFVLRIMATGSPHVSNIQVFHANDEAALASGEIFGKKFKERLQEAKFGVIRFLGWQNGNTTNVTTWATRKPVSYYSYQASELRSSLYAGVTTNSGSAFSATLPNFHLIDKAVVIIKFNASCRGPCTLNVSNTGPIPILNQYAAPLSGEHWYPEGGTSRSIATLVYDETLKGWIKQGGDASMGSMGIDNACPPEIMVRLCAEVGAHPYFLTPPLAIDPATDYIPSFAAYCKANAPSWMVPRFEGPNETWNNASGFCPTGYAKAKATAYGWGPDIHNWYGKAMSVLGQAISTAYGGDRSRYQVLCGVQTALGKNSSAMVSCNDRLASTKYVSQNSPAQSPYSKSTAAKWVTHVTCAQYITPSDYNTTQEQTAAEAFSKGDAETKSTIASAYAATVMSGAGEFTVPRLATLYSNWKIWAKSFGIRKMCGYEGGYSPDYGGSSTLNALRAASKQAPVLVTATAQNYANFVGVTDAEFIAEFPSAFVLSGPSPTKSVWAVLEDIHQTPAPPQWTAIVAFNK